MSQQIKAYSIIIGTTIGAGIFGVPYVIAKSGMFVGILFFILIGAITIILHLIYGEIILSTKEKHRLPGFVKKYLGNKYEKFIKISSTLGYYGSLFAYSILGGKFIFFLFYPILGGSEIYYQFTYLIIFSLFIFLGINPVVKIETYLTFALIIFLFILTLSSVNHFEINNLSIIGNNLENILLPYGVLLFSLSAIPAIPEMAEVLKNNKNKLKKIIINGTLICIFITFIFVLFSVGLTGNKISEESIHSYGYYLGNSALIIGSIIGFLAVSTSFLVIGIYLMDQFKYDFKYNKYKSILLTSLPALIILIFTQNFILIIGLVGAIFSAIDSIVIIKIWEKLKIKREIEPIYKVKISKYIIYIIIFMFIIGAIQEIGIFIF